MDKNELELASKLLATSVLNQLKDEVLKVSTDIVQKFDKSPKPKMDDKLGIKFEIVLSAKVLYEIADQLSLGKVE